MKMFEKEIPPKKKERVTNEEAEILNEQKNNLESTASPEMMAQAEETAQNVEKFNSLLERAEGIMEGKEGEEKKESVGQKLEAFFASEGFKKAMGWTMIAAAGLASFYLFKNFSEIHQQWVAVPGGNYMSALMPTPEKVKMTLALFGGVITGFGTLIGAGEQIKNIEI